MTSAPNSLLDRLRAATANEYIIEGELARGGMAAVFLGRDIALHRYVAVKVMLPDLAGVAGIQDRFVVEARTAAQLDHPGIVTIYAVKQSAGLSYIVMKYIEGQTLDQVLATRGVLDPGDVATIGSQVAEALHFAHLRGVVHRDVKPGNIIIDTNGRPIVADFGIAKVSTGPSLTLKGSTIGTPGYMSPEQCQGLAVTAASDQYSLGVVLYELLVGRPPFTGAMFDVMNAHTSDPPPSILAARPEIEPALEAIIMIMLAKNETERFPSLRDVSKALLSLIPRGSPSADRPAIVAVVSPTTHETTTPVTAGDAAAAQTLVGVPESIVVAGTAPPRSARNRQVAAVVAAAVLLLGVIGYAIASRTAGTKTATRPAVPTQAGRVDTIAPTKPGDRVVATKPETSRSVRADTRSAKPNATAKLPPVSDSKSSTPSAKMPAAKTGIAASKRDSVTRTHADSIAGRCAALNLKFSVGEELTSGDTLFLRRECAKVRPPGV
jgi:serine/threonine protein kinase